MPNVPTPTTNRQSTIDRLHRAIERANGVQPSDRPARFVALCDQRPATIELYAPGAKPNGSVGKVWLETGAVQVAASVDEAHPELVEALEYCGFNVRIRKETA